ncbi:ABC transporter permease subunit [Microvirga tunisiensis]|uniref:ABC transporter permease subunit n=1 Tax=Pannonibacter tanglangensis TaxID=2750084 RepID=A0A7X5F4L3_9HYPH|nr:ABC transporter permease [Pannonibacter sp. XCT-53]NBN79641.1 ABC transporter permease subunit [Pannonibacter sp. XCT-53]
MTARKIRAGLAERLQRLTASDVWSAVRRSPTALLAATVTLLFVAAALFAPLIAPQDPFDLATISVLDARLPPLWMDGGDARFLLGTDDQGRDILSAILYGLRVSLAVGLTAVAIAATAGIAIGLAAGYAGGWADAALMRLADVQLTFPAILIALLIDGALHGLVGRPDDATPAFVVLVLALSLSFWVQYARTVRGATMVEKTKDYVLAARIMGLPAPLILLRHILPNVLGPVLVIATINLAVAILTEATLSFLGVGMPPTEPSLGTLIATGNDFLYGGEWWIALFPGGALALLVLAVNLLGDVLRDALNPKLR